MRIVRDVGICIMASAYTSLWWLVLVHFFSCASLIAEDFYGLVLSSLIISTLLIVAGIFVFFAHYWDSELNIK